MPAISGAMSVRFFLFLIALLALLPLRAAALDPEVSAELERIARDPTNDATDHDVNIQNLVFLTVLKSCEGQQQTTQERCNRSRLLYVLDGSGVLLERCGPLIDSDAIFMCMIAGAEALPLVAALGGDPRKDIDWGNTTASYFRLRGQFQDAARRRCQSTGDSAEAEVQGECVIREQAAMLSFPPAAGSYCAGRPKYGKQRCLDALVTLAVYLEAMKRAQHSSPL